jgi:lipooligosaccharide transport system permease protein
MAGTQLRPDDAQGPPPNRTPADRPRLSRALAAFSAWLHAYRRVWRGSAVNTLLVPVLNLAALGYGLGSLVNGHGGIQGLPYAQFLAPGLLASGVMQTATDESMFPVMGALRWNRTYHAMTATPLTSSDVFVGHLTYVLARAVSSASVFTCVLWGLGLLHGPTSLLVVPFAFLLAAAFATPVMAFSVRARNDESFALLYRFVWIPMFLFAGAFFPVSQLPEWLQPVAVATPLWHGVELCRAATLDRLSWPAVAVHVLYLVAFAVGGFVLSVRAYRGVLAR